MLIQAQQRMLVARKRFLRTLRATVLIQRHMRGRSVRRHMAEQHVAAVCIQVGDSASPGPDCVSLLRTHCMGHGLMLLEGMQNHGAML